MRRRSSIASALPRAAIGRMSPCATTRPMCSSGVAFSQTVKQCGEQQVEGPARRRCRRGVAITARRMALRSLLRARAARSGGSRPGRRAKDLATGCMPAIALDLAVELDERHAAARRRAARPSVDLAGAAQADQRDALAPRPRRSPARRTVAASAARASASSASSRPRRTRGSSATRASWRVSSPTSSASEQSSARASCAQEQHRRVADAHLEVREVPLRDVGAPAPGPCASCRGARAARACARRARAGTGPSSARPVGTRSAGSMRSAGHRRILAGDLR